MQLTLNKLAVLFASVAIAFGAAFTAYAYDNLEIQIDIEDENTKVEVSYEEDGEDMEDEYTYDTTNLDEVYTLLAAQLGLTEQEVEDAVTDIDNQQEVDEGAMDDAEEAMDDASDAIDAAQGYLDELDSDDDADELAAGDEKLGDAADLLAEAQTAFDAGDYELAEEKADAAKDLAEDVYKVEDENEDGDDDRSDFCERTKQAAGYGVAKKCIDEDDWRVNDKLQEKVERRTTQMDKYADYGKSTDRVELQNQLRELLMLLIQLMQQQMALQEASS